VGTRHPSESKACEGPSKTYLAWGAWGGPVEKLLPSKTTSHLNFSFKNPLFYFLFYLYMFFPMSRTIIFLLIV
jgi:hypothetical protein